MYLARFSYDVLPVNRGRAMEFIQQEVKSARSKGLNARLLVPLTRGERGAALQFEWMHAFSEILTSPPEVTILRLVDGS